jgi:hypothetical protein
VQFLPRDTRDRYLARPNLMLKRYGEKALEESEARADELAAADDYNGVAVWRRIRDAVAQLTNKTPPGPVH